MSGCNASVKFRLSGVPSRQRVYGAVISTITETGAKVSGNNIEEEEDGSFGVDLTLECSGKTCLIQELERLNLKESVTITGSCSKEVK
ncbi:MAG TPA: hypothetical protein VI795_03240 [Patescibacteria group bacterium]|nr:hypothetical protein [Patescibacteria group bacterium]